MGVDNRRRVGRCADCNEDQPIVARGMCRRCYCRDYRRSRAAVPAPAPRPVVVKPRQEQQPRPVVIPSVLAGLVREAAL